MLSFCCRSGLSDAIGNALHHFVAQQTNSPPALFQKALTGGK